MSTIKIQYVSDYTCPYCYASRVSLLEAIEGYDVEIEWLPYEGTPLSKPQVDSYHDPIRKRNYRRLISPVIKELGLDMKLPPRVIPRPYTHLAAEGHLFANEHGLGEVYDARVYSILHGRTGSHNNLRCRLRRKWLWILTFYQHKNQQGNCSHMEHALLVLFYLSKKHTINPLFSDSVSPSAAWLDGKPVRGLQEPMLFPRSSERKPFVPNAVWCQRCRIRSM